MFSTTVYIHNTTIVLWMLYLVFWTVSCIDNSTFSEKNHSWLYENYFLCVHKKDFGNPIVMVVIFFLGMWLADSMRGTPKPSKCMSLEYIFMNYCLIRKKTNAAAKLTFKHISMVHPPFIEIFASRNLFL